MKRIRRPERLVRHARRLERRRAHSRARRKQRLRHRNFARIGVTVRTDAIVNLSRNQPRPYTYIEAPEVLSVVRNPEQVASFIEQLRSAFDKRRPVFVVLLHVRELDYDGLVVLLSILVRFKAKKIPFNGNSPSNKKARRLLDESRFFDHLLPRKFKDKDTYTLQSASSIFTHASTCVDSTLGERLIADAAVTVWGERRRCSGVQRTLIELMQNTNNHAASSGEEDKHWWLSVYHNQEKKLVTFSFVDYGVGVFRSLRSKQPNQSFYGALEHLLDKFRFGGEAEVLRQILEGELHRTASGKYYRGKGLPGIYEKYSEGKIANLAMVTNNVYYNSRTNEFRKLEHEFQGTFVSWELNMGSGSLPYDS
jgi:hypothetical protein